MCINFNEHTTLNDKLYRNSANVDLYVHFSSPS